MIARRASGSRSIWSIESPSARTTDSGTSLASRSGSATRSLRRATSARGRTTAIEATNPKRNQSKAGGRGRGRLRRRQDTGVLRSSSHSTAAAAGPGQPARAGTRTRCTSTTTTRIPPIRTKEPARRLDPTSSVTSAGPPRFFCLAALRRVDPDQAEQDAQTGGQSNGKHLTDDRRRRRVDRRRPATRARRRSSSRRSRRAESSRSRPQLQGVGPTRAAPLPRSRARCGARSSTTLDDTLRSSEPLPPSVLGRLGPRPSDERSRTAECR